jgi:cytochrome c oxidase subunit 2
LRAVRRGSLVQLIVLGLIAAAITGAVAYWIPWLPNSAGEEADRIDFVFWFVTVISIVVFATVIAVLVYSVAKFRAKPDDLSDGPPTHGHTGLEIVWTAIPAVLVTAISIVSAIVLAQNSRAGDDALEIKVVAQQFAWQFTYPNGQTYGSLRIPEGRPTRLDITAKDVLHSFWVPQLAQKQDAVPGEHNRIVITPNRTGTFPVICTELCGLGHAIMRTQVEVMEPAAYRRWVRSGGKSTGNEDPGLAVFNGQGCNGCHTFAAAASAGQIGPSLDKLPAEAKGADKPLEEFIRESILEPDAYVEPGYQAGVMPSFESQIPAKDLDALVQYLAENAKS